MPRQAATIGSLPQAFEVVKEMQADGLGWGEGYRPLGRQAPAGIIKGRMAEAADRRRDTLDAGAACSPPCRSSGTASPSRGTGRTGSGTSPTGSAQPTGRPSRPTSTPS